MRVEYVVVARRAQPGRTLAQVRFRGVTEPERCPVPPEHLYRPGSGRTLCRLDVDETWERFPDLAGILSEVACAECRAAHVPSDSSFVHRPGGYERPRLGAPS